MDNLSLPASQPLREKQELTFALPPAWGGLGGGVALRGWRHSPHVSSSQAQALSSCVVHAADHGQVSSLVS